MLGWIPTYAEYCEQNPQTYQKECATYNIFLVAIWQVGKALDATAPAITAIATGFIAWFTLTLKHATDRLWDAGERQLSHLSETAQRQLRAYLHVDDVVMSLMNSHWNPNIQIIVKNYGQTPAYNIINTFTFRPLVKESDEMMFNLDRIEPVELADLGPTQKTFSTSSMPVNQWNELKPILIARAWQFYVFGRLDYHDAFGKARRTEYRYRLLIDAEGIPDQTSLVIDGHAGNKST